MRTRLIINGLIGLGSVFVIASASAQGGGGGGKPRGDSMQPSYGPQHPEGQGGRIIESGGGITCRTVAVPGSGEGPREVCERSVQKCHTVVVPGSGQGPQEVCERVVQTCHTAAASQVPAEALNKSASKSGEES